MNTNLIVLIWCFIGLILGCLNLKGLQRIELDFGDWLKKNFAGLVLSTIGSILAFCMFGLICFMNLLNNTTPTNNMAIFILLVVAMIPNIIATVFNLTNDHY